jgi:hypothetical protein
MNKNPQYLDPAAPVVKMWKVMAELGEPIAPFGHFFAMTEGERTVPLPLLQYVFGPLVVHVDQIHATESPMGSITPDMLKRWRPRVSVERLEILCGERPDLVSPTELVLVMYNAALWRPLSHNARMLYLWAGQRATTAVGMNQALDLGPGALQLPTDDEIFVGWLNRDYRDLANEIIRKVIANSKITRRTTRQ